ncbi:MAG: NUDIX hydrolase [Hadesarchaea archaeon]|nr:NUDIX hydrolase [Hadesarchaea archaeon]
MKQEKTPLLAVDIIINLNDKLVLIKRKNEPYKGEWALPGGFVKEGEIVEEAARREAREETGLKIKINKLVGVYSKPDRDPRGHIVSICFEGEKIGGELESATDAEDVKVFKEIPWNRLAFDHNEILREAGFR